MINQECVLFHSKNKFFVLKTWDGILWASKLKNIWKLKCIFIIGSQQKTHTLPSSARINKTLKSSLSKTSSLRRPTNYKFEADDSLQQIVKQKRENCLQVFIQKVQCNFKTCSMQLVNKMHKFNQNWICIPLFGVNPTLW